MHTMTLIFLSREFLFAFFLCAFRASSTGISALYRSFPLVSAFADPPSFFICARSNIRWQKLSILYRMPFRCKRRIQCCQIVITNDDFLTSTIRTSASGISARYNGFLLMTFFTLPPYFFVRSNRDVTCFKITVFCWMPL